MEIKMWCQIWRFQLRNTLILSRKKFFSSSRNPRFLRSFDVVFHMFRCINQTFHKTSKLAGVKLEKEMWCYIMLFPLINTLKSPCNKKKKIEESATVFFKTMFLLQRIHIVFHMLEFIYQTFDQNKI